MRKWAVLFFSLIIICATAFQFYISHYSQYYYREKMCYNKLKFGRFRMKQIKIVVEKHPDGYVAYPLGGKGIVVGQGDTYEEALSEVKSAIRFHIETFGKQV